MGCCCPGSSCPSKPQVLPRWFSGVFFFILTPWIGGWKTEASMVADAGLNLEAIRCPELSIVCKMWKDFWDSWSRPGYSRAKTIEIKSNWDQGRLEVKSNWDQGERGPSEQLRPRKNGTKEDWDHPGLRPRQTESKRQSCLWTIDSLVRWARTTKTSWGYILLWQPQTSTDGFMLASLS